jgi:hypothetical protein
MLAKRPEDRFQTPAELSAALAGCLEQLGLTPPPLVLPAYWTAWVPRSTWWRSNAAWLVPVTLLVAAVLALGIKWHREAPTPTFTELQIPPVLEQDQQTGRQGDKGRDLVAPEASPR